MQFHFTGRNMDVTPALKNFTEEKMERLERRHQAITKVNVVLTVDHVDHIAEATLHLDGTDIHAKAIADDMYRAIDELVDKLITQVTKHKEKHTDHR